MIAPVPVPACAAAEPVVATVVDTKPVLTKASIAGAAAAPRGPSLVPVRGGSSSPFRIPADLACGVGRDCSDLPPARRVLLRVGVDERPLLGQLGADRLGPGKEAGCSLLRG